MTDHTTSATGSALDPAALDKLEALARAATPGPWSWWTSNSQLRLTANGGPDGGVLHAYAIRGHADVSCSAGDMAFIASFNPTTLLQLIALARRATQQADSLDDGETARLRRVVNALGMQREVPEDDATLRGCLFSMLGMIARKLEQQAEPQSSNPAALSSNLQAGTGDADELARFEEWWHDWRNQYVIVSREECAQAAWSAALAATGTAGKDGAA